MKSKLNLLACYYCSSYGSELMVEARMNERYVRCLNSEACEERVLNKPDMEERLLEKTKREGIPYMSYWREKKVSIR